MPSHRYVVKSSVEETMDMIKLSQSTSTPIFDEIRTFGDGKKLATLAYERYFFRASNRAALFITIHNFHGDSEVTAISTGSSDNLIFNFDWGAANNYIKSVKKALSPVLISETKIDVPN
ncbi:MULTISPECIES: DUF6054 family protein [Listeria]|uniref:DUF6054 family protein n=1 Tax=Listeria TaxID=1637 RepID=UPI000B594929|nr:MULTISPECIES: DUF6054 family protein [Listeria]